MALPGTPPPGNFVGYFPQQFLGAPQFYADGSYAQQYGAAPMGTVVSPNLAQMGQMGQMGPMVTVQPSYMGFMQPAQMGFFPQGFPYAGGPMYPAGFVPSSPLPPQPGMQFAYQPQQGYRVPGPGERMSPQPPSPTRMASSGAPLAWLASARVVTERTPV
jgi:hypothetical protein